jgi:hypothetical protein
LGVGTKTVGGGVATWPDQAFEVTQGINPGDKITAMQTLATFNDSDLSTSVSVLPKPTAKKLSEGAFHPPFHVCGSSVALVGLYPGAKVRVSSNSEPLGEGLANEYGVAQVDLTRRLKGADNLIALQTACGIQTPEANPISGGNPKSVPTPLAAPSIDPLFMCGQALYIRKVTPGALILRSLGATGLRGTVPRVQARRFQCIVPGCSTS